MGNAEAAGDVGGAGLAVLGQQVGDQLGIVLQQGGDLGGAGLPKQSVYAKHALAGAIAAELLMLHRPKHLSTHFRLLSQRVEAGQRETPQRFRSLAWRIIRCCKAAGMILSLYSWILRGLLDEFRRNPDRSPVLAALVERTRLLAEEAYDPEEMAVLEAEVLGLAPHRQRRRSIHCHGAIADDRVLLVLRTMLPTLDDIRVGWGWHVARDDQHVDAVQYTVAYYVSDYDWDHFEMIGPEVAYRLRGLALWCQGVMPGDGLDSLSHTRDQPGPGDWQPLDSL